MWFGILIVGIMLYMLLFLFAGTEDKWTMLAQEYLGIALLVEIIIAVCACVVYGLIVSIGYLMSH